ncbi:MAG: MIP/aquaporin family protein [Nitrososphaera sp.]
MLKTSSSRLGHRQQVFLAELVGTFVVVALATGSVVMDARFGGALGLPFIAFAPFAGVAVGVFFFSRVSMAVFNPAVLVGYLITGHIKKSDAGNYLVAQLAGAFAGSAFVMAVIGTDANLGANAPNYSYALPLIFGIEVLASALLMAVILFTVYNKGLRGFGPIAIGGMVGLDIFFFASISGASMNPARSLAPAVLSGAPGDLWLYWTATFLGAAIAAIMVKKKFGNS